MTLAKGKYLQFMNAGDVYSDDNVLKKVFPHDNKLDYDIVYGVINLVDEEYQHIDSIHYQDFSIEKLKNQPPLR